MSGHGVPCLLPLGIGSEGRGQTKSMSSMRQNGHICSYSYYCLSALKPRGDTTFGNSSGCGCPGLLQQLLFDLGRVTLYVCENLPCEFEVILNGVVFNSHYLLHLGHKKKLSSQML